MTHGRPAPFLLVAAALTFAACVTAPGPKVRDEMVVSTDWLASRIGKPGVVVVHVGGHKSGKEGYDAGHLPGARFVPWEEIAIPRGGVPNEIPPAESIAATVSRLGIGSRDRIVLYDAEVGLWAARAYVVLDYAGLGDRTSLLDGHLRMWKAEGRALSTEAAAPEPIPFTPRLHPEIVVPFEAVRDYSWTRERDPRAPVELIDARPEAQFTGEQPGDAITRPGRIPGAASVYWMKQIASEENPVLKPERELRDLYEEAGATGGETVIAYCRTGVQASHSYFVAKYLGYDVRLYDGSFIEWNAVADAPVATGPASE